MTDFVREIDQHYPTYDEVEAILRKARRMRARAMRDGVTDIVTMLQRAITRKPTAKRICDA